MFCEKSNVKYTIEEGVENERNVVRQVVRDFIRSLKPKSRGKSIKVRDYQIDAVHHCIARNRALIVSPTASGKSLIIYGCPALTLFQSKIFISALNPFSILPRSYNPAAAAVSVVNLLIVSSLENLFVLLHQ